MSMPSPGHCNAPFEADRSGFDWFQDLRKCQWLWYYFCHGLTAIQHRSLHIHIIKLKMCWPFIGLSE